MKASAGLDRRMDNAPLQALQDRCAGVVFNASLLDRGATAGHFDVAETVQCEARLPHLLPIAFEGISVGLACARMTFAIAANALPELLLRLRAVACVAARVQRPVGVEAAPVSEGDRLAGPPAHPQPAPTGDDLPQVEETDARAGAGQARRRPRFDDTHGRDRLRHQHAPGRGHSRCRLPGRIIITGAIPARPFPAGIVALTVAEIVVGDRAGGHLPGAIGDDADLFAIRELDDQLQQQFGSVAVGRALAGRRRDVLFGAVPAMPQHDAHDVGACLQPLGYIMAHIEDARAQGEGLIVGVVGVAGIQHALPHLGAVEGKLPIAQAGHVERCPPHGPVQGECPAQQRRRDAPVGRADPAALPIAGLQQPHAEYGRRCLAAGAPLLIPHPHRPPAPFIAGERRAAIDDVGRPR